MAVVLGLGNGDENRFSIRLLVRGPAVPAVDQLVVLIDLNRRQYREVVRIALHRHRIYLHARVEILPKNDLPNFSNFFHKTLLRPLVLPAPTGDPRQTSRG